MTCASAAGKKDFSNAVKCECCQQGCPELRQPQRVLRQGVPAQAQVVPHQRSPSSKSVPGPRLRRFRPLCGSHRRQFGIISQSESELSLLEASPSTAPAAPSCGTLSGNAPGQPEVNLSFNLNRMSTSNDVKVGTIEKLCNQYVPIML